MCLSRCLLSVWENFHDNFTRNRKSGGAWDFRVAVLQEKGVCVIQLLQQSKRSPKKARTVGRSVGRRIVAAEENPACVFVS